MADLTPSKLLLPSLSCPFPSLVSPYADQVDKETFSWLVAGRMIEDPSELDRYREAGYGWLGARTYPYAGHDMLRLVTDWCVWLFAFDDAFCESDRRAAEIARALPQLLTVLDDDLQPGLRVENPFALAMLDIKGRVRAAGNADQLDRWRTVTKDYLFAQVWEAANREDAVVPTYGDYIFMRRRTGAMLTVFALIDLATGHPLTPDEWRHPDLRAITESANDVVVWDNDLLSYAKERNGVNARNNLVNVLARHRHRSIQQSMNHIGRMRDAAIMRMVALRAALEALHSTAVAAYVRGLEHWISGSVAYSLTSSRYTHAWRDFLLTGTGHPEQN
ncbi:4-epi-cubebol synthase [Sphaerisporangium perillae]|uniref:4-epi-cubebol synthase n=1 Tax=Sphaerisporangium perillae TaxID=2935860 RepID=UPI00200F83BA|nr:4-epi-cubebol synthase [Sphaerisporangium perillae]